MNGTAPRGARWGLLAVAALLSLSACGKSAKDEIAATTPAVQALRAKLNTIVGGLPSFGSGVSMSMAQVDPKPVYDRKAGSFNTAFASVEQLKDDSRPAFDLGLDSDLAQALAWTGGKNPMDAAALDAPAGAMSDTIANGLATPYVVITRTVSYEAPVATADGTSFEGGNADIEAFFVPVDRNTWTASCRIAATSDDKVQISIKKGEDPKAPIEAFALSTLLRDARAKLAACLTEQTGGTFQFEAQ
ncbi:MAG: hypothetical protein IT548_02195 [Alphaproteobacteria bacterium]|nr:hypothetical protein [Alphaproteobacteria bacterium]